MVKSACTVYLITGPCLIFFLEPLLEGPIQDYEGFKRFVISFKKSPTVPYAKFIMIY